MQNPPDNTAEEQLLAEVQANDVEVPELDTVTVQRRRLPEAEMRAAVTAEDDES